VDGAAFDEPLIAPQPHRIGVSPLRRFLLPLAAVLFAAAAAPAATDDDPYLWLEEVEGARALAQVRDWNKSTEDLLTRDPKYESYRSRARAILDDERQIATPDDLMGDKVANLWRDARNPRGLWRVSPLAAYRSGKPQWRTLIDVDALVHQDGVVCPARIRLRHGADCVHAGQDEIRGQRQRLATPLEFGLAPRAVGEHRRHVRLEHRRDVGSGVQETFHHVRCDTAAHRRVWNTPQPLLRRRFGGCRRGDRSLRLRCEHVFDRDAPARAAAGDVFGAQSAFREQPAHGRALTCAARRPDSRTARRRGGRNNPRC